MCFNTSRDEQNEVEQNGLAGLLPQTIANVTTRDGVTREFRGAGVLLFAFNDNEATNTEDGVLSYDANELIAADGPQVMTAIAALIRFISEESGAPPITVALMAADMATNGVQTPLASVLD